MPTPLAPDASILTWRTLPAEATITTSLGKVIAIKESVASLIYAKPRVKSDCLSKEDKEQYEKLCSLYRFILVAHPPKQWVLDEDACPLYYSRLIDSTIFFQAYLNHLNSMNFSMKTTVIQTVSYIQKLFQSLNKRKGITSGIYRKDGFEAMFFTELALWLSVDYPGHSAIAQETADLLANRIQYCEAVAERVLLSRRDAGISNPRSQLRQIITNLKSLQVDVNKSIQTARYTAQIHEIDCQLKDMVVDAFQLCHFVIKGVNQERVHVREFLTPDTIHTKVHALLKTIMGAWIKATFELAGIKQDNFDPTHHLSIALIDAHLEDIDLNKVDWNQSGLLDFARDIGATSKEKIAQSTEFLRQIREIHRAILNVCYARNALKHAMIVAQDEDHSWLHGHQYGAKMVRGILAMTEDAKMRLVDATTLFWKSFYKEAYSSYAIKNGKDSSDKTYTDLAFAGEHVDAINEKSLKIDMVSREMRSVINSYLLEPDHSCHRMISLASLVCEYIDGRTVRVPVDDGLSSLEEAPEVWTKDFKVIIAGARVQDSIIISPVSYQSLPKVNSSVYPLRFSLSMQPVFNLIGQSARDLMVPTLSDLKLAQKPKKFHSMVQQYLYELFLAPYQGAVEAHDWLSPLYGTSWLKIQDLRCFYAELNRLFTAVYEVPVVAGYQFLFKKPPAVAAQIKAKQIYIELMGVEQIRYTVKNSKGALIKKTIAIAELALGKTSSVEVDDLKFCPESILSITAKRGDTPLSSYLTASEEIGGIDGLSTEEYGALSCLKRAEHSLIDQHIVTRMLNIAQTLGYNELKVFGLAKNTSIQFKQYTEKSEKFIELSLEPKQLIFAKSTASIAVNQLKQALDDEKIAHQAVLCERDSLMAVQAVQKLQIEEKEKTMQQQAALLVEQDAEIQALRQRIKMMEERVDSLDREGFEKTKMLSGHHMIGFRLFKPTAVKALAVSSVGGAIEVGKTADMAIK